MASAGFWYEYVDHDNSKSIRQSKENRFAGKDLKSKPKIRLFEKLSAEDASHLPFSVVPHEFTSFCVLPSPFMVSWVTEFGCPIQAF